MPDAAACPADAGPAPAAGRAALRRPDRRPPPGLRPFGTRALRAAVAIALGALLAYLSTGCAGSAAAGSRAGSAAGRAAAAPAAGASPAAAEARHADLAMAAAVAARDVEAFAGHVAADGIFFGPRGAAPGRAAVALAWAPYFQEDGPRLAWSPDRALASASGDLVFTFGAWRWTSAAGGPEVTGRYLTAWRRDADGLLRVALDGGAEPLPELPAGVAFRPLRTLQSADGELLAEGGLLLEGEREAGWYLRLSRREGPGLVPLAESGGWRPRER